MIRQVKPDSNTDNRIWAVNITNKLNLAAFILTHRMSIKANLIEHVANTFRLTAIDRIKWSYDLYLDMFLSRVYLIEPIH